MSQCIVSRASELRNDLAEACLDVAIARFTATVWEHEGAGSWHFLDIPGELADDLAARHPRGAGFGSIRVEVTIGNTTWRTSLFPDAKRRTYVLPLKKAVRAAEGLHAGSSARVRLVLLE